MCENCEVDLENYNKSLKVKSNLLNKDQRQSYLHHSNENSMMQQDGTGGALTTGAPRSILRKQSTDNFDEFMTVRYFLRLIVYRKNSTMTWKLTLRT